MSGDRQEALPTPCEHVPTITLTDDHAFYTVDCSCGWEWRLTTAPVNDEWKRGWWEHVAREFRAERDQWRSAAIEWCGERDELCAKLTDLASSLRWWNEDTYNREAPDWRDYKEFATNEH